MNSCCKNELLAYETNPIANTEKYLQSAGNNFAKRMSDLTARSHQVLFTRPIPVALSLQPEPSRPS